MLRGDAPPLAWFISAGIVRLGLFLISDANVRDIFYIAKYFSENFQEKAKKILSGKKIRQNKIKNAAL